MAARRGCRLPPGLRAALRAGGSWSWESHVPFRQGTLCCDSPPSKLALGPRVLPSVGAPGMCWCSGPLECLAGNGRAGAAACRCERDFGGSGTIGRGPSMYEMEGPRLVLRHRPADCSASFAPLDRLPGPVTNQWPSCPDHWRLRISRAGWLGVSPSPVTETPPAPVAQGLPSPGGSGFSPDQWSGGSPRRGWLQDSANPVGPRCPFTGWPGVFPSPVA
jgi:hypothetical protein